MKSKLLRWGRWLAGGLLLLALLQGFVSADFKFQREISIVDIATGFLTLFLALYIPSRLERRLSSQRYEKEVLIRHIERLQLDLTAIWDIVQMSQKPLARDDSNSVLRLFTIPKGKWFSDFDRS